MDYTSPAELEAWLEQLDSLAVANRYPAPRFIKPFHLATLAHKLRLAALTEFRIPDKLASYANTMQLWEALGLTPPEPVFQRNNAGRYHPLEVLKDVTTVETTAGTLVQLLKPVCSDGTTLGAVDTMLRELVDNCYSHSDVSDGVAGMICAQVWGAGGKAQIALVDTGIGIRKSLALNPALQQRLECENSCEIATEYGVTGKPGKGHSGYGLAVARGLIAQSGGVLIVRSGNEGFCFQSGKSMRINTERAWHGTLVIVEWDLYTTLNIRDVYSSFPLPEGMSDDDFNFDDF